MRDEEGVAGRLAPVGVPRRPRGRPDARRGAQEPEGPSGARGGALQQGSEIFCPKICLTFFFQ